MSVLTILIVLLVVSMAGGYWGQRNPNLGYYSWSPMAVLLVILLVLLATGSPHLRLR